MSPHKEGGNIYKKKCNQVLVMACLFIEKHMFLRILYKKILNLHFLIVFFGNGRPVLFIHKCQFSSLHTLVTNIMV